ncbi:MAG: Gfo/Idh/MocA family protein [Vicinamibacterales bacterium]
MRTALFGPGRAGRLHARMLHGLGCPVTDLVGRRPDRTRAAADELQAEYGHVVTAHVDAGRLLASRRPDLVVIASPPETHADHLEACVRHGVAVLCEKPLCWSAGAPTPDQWALLRRLESMRAARVGLNLHNRFFVRALRRDGRIADRLSRLSVTLHTSGLHRGAAIGLDLLPHAVSILRSLAGGAEIGTVERDVGETRAVYRFRCGHLDVCFDLAEGDHVARALAIRLDDDRFERVQAGRGAAYRVHLLGPGGVRVETDDPFRLSVAAAVDRVRSGRGVEEARDEAWSNMRDVLTILGPPS